MRKIIMAACLLTLAGCSGYRYVGGGDSYYPQSQPYQYQSEPANPYYKPQILLPDSVKPPSFKCHSSTWGGSTHTSCY